MSKLIVTEWMSLDGITDAGTMAVWFNPYHSESRAASIRETIHDCDVMLYGRNTYQMLYPYWSAMQHNEMGVADKLNSVNKYVVAATLEEAPWANTTIIRDNVVKAVETLKSNTGGNILVQGSTTLVKTLMQAGLVDELNLLVQPHIMGTGQPSFFNDMPGSLGLTALQQLENGVVQLRYRPLQAGA